MALPACRQMAAGLSSNSSDRSGEMSTNFRTKITIVLVAVVVIVGLASCATQDDSSKTIPSSGNDCFWANSIHNWKVIDDESLIVWSPSRSCPYLVELARRCLSIRFTEDLGFYDRDGRICPYGGDAVIVPGPTGDRCSIASIRRISPDELNVLLADDSAPDNPTSDTDKCEPDPDLTN